MATAVPDTTGPEVFRRHPADPDDDVPIAGTAAVVTGTILRAARRAQDLGLADAARALGTTAAGLAGIEGGVKPPSPRDLTRLLDLYELPRADLHWPALTSLLDRSYGETAVDDGPGWYERLAWCEAEAERTTVYSATTLPHPVHTTAYSRLWWQAQVVRDAPPPEAVEARRRRPDDDRPMTLYLDESVLWRHTATTRAAIAAQFTHLSSLPWVEIRIVPLGLRAFPAGILTALSLGSCRYLCAEETGAAAAYSTGRAAAQRDTILTTLEAEARTPLLSASLLRGAVTSYTP
ncbi:Scr1 family TA system antitoxin-like transcriptional regulator [Streptomyces yaizuensis]|uniref:Helix-turn-helix domain-containing protein n=1 Tax=Streptomyces yaizuensis TaxID=2989713 RepID=A0AA86JBM4_9ACTN|nr:Scr1 family TA system antitoxin-like transcriptional regulator [Streptomyces sp. YSPA8]BDT39558.1 helix-turn-helix domain-containing protein [Streptomyces sp. YSPA8]